MRERHVQGGPGKVLSMGSENEIQRWRQDYRGDWYRHPEGKHVLHADHVAVRKADQERIAELEAREKILSQSIIELCDGLAKEQAIHIEKVMDDYGIHFTVPASLSTGEREGVVEGGFAAGVTKNDGVNTTEGEDENT